MAGVKFIRVCEDDNESPIEVPIEDDGTVLLATLKSVFPKSTGLKYLAPDSGCLRGVRLNDGKLYAPSDGWVHVYQCALPRENKRKGIEEKDTYSSKFKKLEEKKCTDLIVLNLAWKTDESTLKEYFSRYGDLVTVQLEGDRQEVSRKVHVGGITESITASVLRDYFSQFGAVLDVFIPKPFRSFAFVSFEDPEVAAELLGKDQVIEGVCVSIGSAVPKLHPQQNRNGPMYPNSHFGNSHNPWAWQYNSVMNGHGSRDFNPGMYNSMQGYNMASHSPFGNNFSSYQRQYNSYANRINM
uniref:TAR DNA-binding protein 43 n=1 Tax=Schistosoma haematobium TaxID=6185 RepID=A0A094ZDD7_SCHHA